MAATWPIWATCYPIGQECIVFQEKLQKVHQKSITRIAAWSFSTNPAQETTRDHTKQLFIREA